MSKELSLTQYKLSKAEAQLKIFNILQTNASASQRVNEKQCGGSLKYEESGSDEDDDEGCSAEDLLEEIRSIKSIAAFRSTPNSFLGRSMKKTIAMLKLREDDPAEEATTMNPNTTSSDSSPSDGEVEGCAPQTSKSNNFHKFQDHISNYISRIQEYLNSLSTTPENEDTNHYVTTASEEKLTTTSGESVDGEKMAELAVLAEQASDNRTAVIHMAIELQILRDNLHRATTKGIFS